MRYRCQKFRINGCFLACRHRLAVVHTQEISAGHGAFRQRVRPVRSDDHRSLVGMGRVVQVIFHAGGEQHRRHHTCHCHISSCMLHVLIPLKYRPYQCYTCTDGSPPVLAFLALAYTHAVNDLVFLIVGIEIAQSEVEVH